MANQAQALIIDPASELTFTGPFNVPVCSTLTLRNPSSRKICFKIKTTAPKRYCVKPNSGVIDPKQSSQIAVVLQPFEFDPNEKNRHKFMVQSTFAPDGEINQDTLWKETDSSQVMDSKLKCVFVMRDKNDSQASNGNGGDSSSVKPELVALPATKEALTVTQEAGDVSANYANLKTSVDEIKKLQEEISALRHENIQLKEEALRQKRLAAAASSYRPEMSSSSGLSEATAVHAMSPDHNALSVTYLYAALVLLVVGIVCGKWIF